MIEEGQKKRRRKRKLGPASRALKQYYQSKQFVPAPFRRPAAAAAEPAEPAAESAARSSSISFEHKYNDDDDDDDDDASSTTLFNKQKSSSFEFKQSDQDLVTPRVPDSSSLHGRNSMLDVALSCSIHAPLKKSRRPRYNNDEDDDEEDFLGDPPDTARIDLSKETSR